jgi:4-amino-4-deoxy-L-arabinose transferase-like glycosyltransferase
MHRSPLDEEVLAHHPPLYYAMLASVLVAADASDTISSTLPNPSFMRESPLRWLHGGDERSPRAIDQFVLSALRFVSVLLGVLSLLAVHRLGQVTCPDRPVVADVATLVVACLPMWSFQHAVLTNDNLVTLLFTATLVVLVRAARRRNLSMERAVLLGALLGLALLTKASAVFLVAVALLVFAYIVVRQRRASVPAGVALLIPGALCAPVLWRNWTLYGAPLALRARDPGSVDGASAYDWSWLRDDAAVIWIGAFVAGLALVGLVAHRLGRHRATLPQPFWLLVAACALVFTGTAWSSPWALEPPVRLLFPAIGPVAVLAAAGLAHLGALLALPAVARCLCVVPPAVAMWFLFGWFAPQFDAALAPAPPQHATLVGGILSEDSDPGILWVSPPPATPQSEPPTLRWHDPAAGQHEHYSLYAYDEQGRVWLATYEQQHLDLSGNALTLPASTWALLPTDRDVFLQLRCVPDWSIGERREWMPISAPLRVRRLATP